MNNLHHLGSSICVALTLLAGGFANAAVLPFSVPATFASTDDGARSHWCFADNTLTLRANGTYVERRIKMGREQYEGEGRWHFDLTNKLIFSTTIADRPEYYRVLNSRSLERLDDANGNQASVGCVVRLTRLSNIVDFSGEMKVVTLFSDIWTLETLGGTRVAFPAAAKPATLSFNKKTKRVNASMGCVRLSGEFVEHGSMLRFSALATTQMACAQKLPAVEARIQNVLERTTAFHICCSTLELMGTEGILASFRTTR